MMCMLNKKYESSINVNFYYMLYKYLFLYEEIYQLSQLSKTHIEKFLVYWYPRTFLDFSDEDVRDVIKNTRVYVEKCSEQVCIQGIETLELDELENELLRVRKISAMVSCIKLEMKRKNVQAGKSIWLQNNGNICIPYQMLTSWFQISKIEQDVYILKGIRDSHLYYIKNDNMFEKLGLQEEIITLEIYKEKEENWEINNIGLVYSPRAKKYLLD